MIIIAILTTIINSARVNAIRFQTECVADMALQSSLAEYNRVLFEKYGLLFVDTGYGTGNSGDTLLENHILRYMEDNFKPSVGTGVVFSRDHLLLNAKDAIVERASCATDINGKVFVKESINSMASEFGISSIQSIIDNTKKINDRTLNNSEVDEAWRRYERKLEEEEEKCIDEDGNKVGVERPYETVKNYRDKRGTICNQTAAYVKGISSKQISLANYISHRSYTNRNGFIQGEEIPGTVEEMLFLKYIMNNSGNYIDQNSDGKLNYEMEYIINGDSSDKNNLENVLLRILAIREAANFTYLRGSGSKQALIKIVVMAISAILLNPELIEPLTMLITLAWSYSESISDIRALLSGKKIPLMKDDSSWSTGLTAALGFNIGNGKDSSGGLSYQDYLYAFLLLTNEQDRHFRFMDVVEMNIRNFDGYENFKIDNCFHDYEVTAIATSKYGGTYKITKLVGYQK